MGKNVAPPVPRAASLLGSDAPGPVRAPWSSDSGPRLAPGLAFTRGSPDPAERCWPPNAPPLHPSPSGVQLRLAGPFRAPRSGPPNLQRHLRRCMTENPFPPPPLPSVVRVYACPSRRRPPRPGVSRFWLSRARGRGREMSAPSLSPPALQEELSQHFIKIILHTLLLENSL